MNRLLTAAQAAHVLAVSVDTLRKWRVSGNGPAYVQLDASHPQVWRGSTIRYNLADLQAFQRRIDARVGHIRGTGELPPEPTVTDAQWAVVEAALRWEHKMGRLAGLIDMADARGQFLALLRLAVVGTLNEAEGVIRRGGPNEEILARWIDCGWLEVAFRALADDPTFGFAMIKQTLVMPRQPQESRATPGLFAAARMKSELIGPPIARRSVQRKAEQQTSAAVSPVVVATALKQARARAWRAAERKRRMRRDLLIGVGVELAPSLPEGSVQIREP